MRGVIKLKKSAEYGDSVMTYPRICAHRGFCTVAPENSIPAFASAIALGAEEIELDLWPTLDGKIVVCHDPSVDRTTDGQGLISGLVWDEIKTLDAGIKFSPHYSGLRIPLFEEILDLFGKKCEINIHIKSLEEKTSRNPAFQERVELLSRKYHPDYRAAAYPISNQSGETLDNVDNMHTRPYPADIFQKILDIIDLYDCREYVYFTGMGDVLTTAMEMTPDIERCCLEGHMNYSIVKNAVAYGCKKVQFCKLFLTRDIISEAHDNGLICNVFWSDNPGECAELLQSGINTILTNDYLAVSKSL